MKVQCGHVPQPVAPNTDEEGKIGVITTNISLHHKTPRCWSLLDLCLKYHITEPAQATRAQYSYNGQLTGSRRPIYRVGQKSDTARTLHYTVREVSLFWPTLYGLYTRNQCRTISIKYVDSANCRAEMYTGRVACFTLWVTVSMSTRQTDGLTNATLDAVGLSVITLNDHHISLIA